MKTAWQIGRIAGVELRIHFTFPLLFAWVALQHFVRTGQWSGLLTSLGFVLLVFGLIVLHELGHVLAARSFGIRTRDITLLPIGGIAHLARMPAHPREELVVALAGPAINLALGLVLLPLAGGPVFPWTAGTLLQQLVWTNFALAAFNLIPAYPLDGGRGLRALLALHYPRERANFLALLVGRIFALLLGMLALAGDPFLIFIALFLWVAAGEEIAAERRQAQLRHVHVGEIMDRDCQVFAPSETLARAANHLLSSAQEDFPVVGPEGRLAGLLRREDLVAGLAHLGPDARIDELPLMPTPSSRTNETVENLLHRWPADRRSVPVLRDDRTFAGLCTAANLGDFILVQDALAGPHPHEPLTA